MNAARSGNDECVRILSRVPLATHWAFLSATEDHELIFLAGSFRLLVALSRAWLLLQCCHMSTVCCL